MTSLLILLALFSGLGAQADVRPPLQDPKAWALLDKADALQVSAKAAGLKDLTFTQTFSQYEGVKLKVKWMAPAHKALRAEVAEDAPEHVKTLANTLERRLRPQVLEMLEGVLGRRYRELHGDAEVSVVSERLVRIVPQNPRVTAQVSEHRVTLDLRGLPVTVLTRRADGSTLEMQTAFESVNGGTQFRVQSVTAKLRREGQPADETVLRYEWCEVKGFHFYKSLVVEHGVDRTIIAFSDHKPDTGLTEKDFAAAH
jgi:hypothetical protein